MTRSDIIDLDARLVHETAAAWLLETEQQDRVWIPKSLAEFDGETLTLPQRIAEEKGLV